MSPWTGAAGTSSEFLYPALDRRVSQEDSFRVLFLSLAMGRAPTRDRLEKIQTETRDKEKTVHDDIFATLMQRE
jgi:hypothetical protein